jgi:hypothetical protein
LLAVSGTIDTGQMLTAWARDVLLDAELRARVDDAPGRTVRYLRVVIAERSGSSPASDGWLDDRDDQDAWVDVDDVMARALEHARYERRALVTSYDLAVAVRMSQRALVLVRVADPDVPTSRWDVLKAGVSGAIKSAAATVKRQYKALRGTPARFLLKPIEWLLKGFHRLLLFVSLTVTFLLTVPGLVVREGSRVFVARLVGSSRRGRRFYWRLGDDFGLEPRLSGMQCASALMLPAIITFGIGVLWILPAIVRRDALGIALLPHVTQDPSGFASASDTDAAARIVTGTSVAVWMGLACLFVALPTLAHVREARHELRRAGRLGRLWSALLAPLHWFASIAAPVDRVLMYAGVPPVFASGLIGVFLGFLVAGPLSHLFY